MLLDFGDRGFSSKCHEFLQSPRRLNELNKIKTVFRITVTATNREQYYENHSQTTTHLAQ